MILILYTAYVITGAMCHEVNQNEEYGTTLNVTTLYPVKDFDVHTKKYNYSVNSEAKSDRKEKVVSENGKKFQDQLEENDLVKESPKEFDKSFRGDKSVVDDIKNKQGEKLQDQLEENDLSKESPKEFDKSLRHDKSVVDDIKNKEYDFDEHEKEKPKIPKLDSSNWKVDTFFTPSKLDKQEDNSHISENKTLQPTGKEFKPSPQLGHFYGEDAFVVPTQPTKELFSPVNKKPSSFFTSPGDYYKLNYKPPTHPDPIDTPYKFKAVSPRDKEWKYSTSIGPKPTVETLEKIPAGGLYKLPDPFKEKPSSDGDDDNFGLDFKDDEKDAKENSKNIKRRGNPWKSLLHLVTALVPVGIIISALTPNILTLETVDNNNYHYGNRFSRRSDGMSAPPQDLPAVSESCKRRLLCELHSDSNYDMRPLHRQTHCYKIQCNDPQALSKVLHWLLLHNRSRGYQPDERERRGYNT